MTDLIPPQKDFQTVSGECIVIDVEVIKAKLFRVFKAERLRMGNLCKNLVELSSTYCLVKRIIHCILHLYYSLLSILFISV